MASRTSTFTTIRTEGALLPPDLLQRIGDPNTSIEGLTPESYHLYPGERLNEVINQGWNRLQGIWASFRDAQNRLPESDLGTSITRERWLFPLFDTLGYGRRLQTAAAIEIDGRSYPISHAWGHVPIHLVSYKLDLDKRTPGVAGASAASPHSLLQVFLNRSEDHLWGFLSNGYKLRILRDNLTLTRQAYVEFDLEAMMDGEVYSDFVLLWLLCHQSRVEGERPSDCWLEKWMKVAVDQGTRALDQLRVGVEKAITALGLGFLEHPSNHELRDKLQNGDLHKDDYYRQLLRLVYRLLFLFVAEDRPLDGRPLLLDPHAPQEACDRYLKYYSTQRLRRLAERFKGTSHADLYEGLRVVMRLLSGDYNGLSAGLALAPLGSFLFRDEAVPDLIACQISNQHFLDAIRALSLTYDQRAQVYRSVDYRNLGPEELGSVYESLLELNPNINVPAKTFALETAGGSERKTTGSYYTPSSLINALLDSALDPVLETVGTRHGVSAEEHLLSLRICDPACGSGHFLIAAAGRLAKKLAELRTGEEEPPPSAIQEAKRDVIGRCIYGVDINPMAVELCKVNLWIEALEPGKPLSFLDNHIRVGNSLLGTTPKLMAGGIPDDAFNPIEGDDKKVASELKKKNREARREREKLLGGQLDFFSLLEPPADYAALTRAAAQLNLMDDDTFADLQQKEAAFAALELDDETQKAQILADAWCAAFVWEKSASNRIPPLTDLTYRRLEDALRQNRPLSDDLIAVVSEVVRLRDRCRFFHWHVAFPDVFPVPPPPPPLPPHSGWNGGFDCVLGNPPWERIKIQEKEWFARRLPDIANAPNAAARKRLIEALVDHDPYLLQEFRDDQRGAEGESHFIRTSGRYPLTGRGDVNTYPLFAENSRHIINGYGRVGMIVPSGIATDDTTKFFFQDLMQTRSLVSLYDFENRDGIFPSVHRSYKFCLLTLAGTENPATRGAEFVFFALNVGDLTDPEKRFTLSAEDIRLLNPNTGTTATFRSKRDAEITKAIYRRVPVLIREEPLENAWGISFLRMFDMSNDSGLFRTREQLEAQGGVLQGNRFVCSEEVYLPLYEAKMMHQYDHRWATYDGADVRDMSLDEKCNPSALSLPRYWVDEREVTERIGNTQWMLGFRDITNTTNERTAIFGLLPRAAVGNNNPIMFLETALSSGVVATLTTNLSSLALDFVARMKLGGTHMNFFLAKQLPVIPPHTYTPELLDFIVPRVLELTYTAWDLQPFAQDVGYHGAPFIWDEERRFLMRCELDALYFHLYQIQRDDVDYIMDTFPIVKRKDIAATADGKHPLALRERGTGGEGEYITKRTILEMYDQMAALPTLSVPAPKDQHATYLVPDVSQWQTWLEPPPADPSVAHPVE